MCLQVAETINSTLETSFPDNFVTITADASRFFVTSAFTLTCNIKFIRPITSGDATQYTYYINEGVYGSFGGILMNNQTLKLKPLKETPHDVLLYSSSIYGSVCDDLDAILEGTLLPELAVGDWLCFEEMGAFTLSLAGYYATPKVYVAASEDLWLYLKMLVPLLEERLESEDVPQNFNVIEAGQDWSLPSLPITIKLPHPLIEEYVLDYVISCNTD